MRNEVVEIRRRLFFLLLRAFVTVLLLSLLLFTLLVGYVLTSSSTPLPLPFVSKLEGYYLARGSWEGVGEAFSSIEGLSALKAALLDEQYRIVFNRGYADDLPVGAVYEPGNQDAVFALTANGQRVGYLVAAPYSLSERLGIARAIIFPIGMIAIMLAIFLMVVATLLVRRFVNPLAEVIYAARAVADGKLDTRIQTEGPQDLRSLSESFNEMAASLERSDRERRDMLADVAHELRTPLSVIRGRLEGIVDGIYPENGSQVSLALEHTYVLERLIDDLRLLTLAEARQLPFDRKQVNLGDVIERVVALFSAEAQEKNIALSFIGKSGNLSANVDPQRFEQVMSNLVGNALRYVPDGGRVWVTAEQSADGTRITVSDNGSGVPESDLPFIFDRFWRKDKSRSRASGGTGLGLAISKQLVEAQDGVIEARNLPEGGLQVMIRFSKGA